MKRKMNLALALLLGLSTLSGCGQSLETDERRQAQAQLLPKQQQLQQHPPQRICFRSKKAQSFAWLQVTTPQRQVCSLMQK